MTEAPRSYPVSTGPYAWRCCDERYPFSYGIVTDRKDTVDAWREGNIKFQELHSFVGGVEALVKRAVDFIRLNDPFGDHFPARDLQILAGEPTNIEEQYENCPCGGNDCSAVPGGPLLGCPYVKDSTSEPEIKLTYVKRWRTIVKLPAKYADEIVEALRETPQPASAAQTVQVPVEVRKQDDTIDEIIIRGPGVLVHIEQMSADGWFMGVNAADGSYWQFWFGAKNRKSRVEFRHTEMISAEEETARRSLSLSSTEGK